MSKRLKNILGSLEFICLVKAKVITASLTLFMLALFASGCCGRFSPTFLLTLKSRDEAVKKTVKKWGEALKNKDRDAYLVAVDKDSPSYYQNQVEVFDNLFEVPFAKVIMKADTNSGLGVNITELSDDFVVKVSLSYVLEGSTSQPLGPIERFIVFEEKNGKWKAKRDVTGSIAEGSLPKDILGFGKLKAISTNHFIILFSPGEEAIAQKISFQADRNFNQIAASFTTAPQYKIPIKICDDYEDVVDIFGETSEATPWASAMAIGAWSDPPRYRIIINQENYNVISTEQREATLAHETAHIVTAPLIGPRTPPFLIEGIAEYFSGYGETHYLKNTLEKSNLSITLDDLIEPEGITRLQGEREYGLAYEESYAAVSLIEEKYGHQALLRLLEEFKGVEEQDDQEDLVNQVFQKVLGIDWKAFIDQWRTYVLHSS